MKNQLRTYKRNQYNDLDHAFWLKHMYPCTIIKDRYTGAYSGGEWTCWPKYIEEIPDEIEAGDIPCMEFWKSYDTSKVGIGDSPNDAVKDLRIKLGDITLVNREYTVFEQRKLIKQTCFACKNLGYGCLGKLHGCDQYDAVSCERLHQLTKILIPKDKINKELYEI